MAASGLPVVVFGHPYPSVENLPFIDRDQRAIGRLLAEYLLAGGYRRIALFMRQRILRGDHLMMEGAREVRAGGPRRDRFSIHCVAQEDDEIDHAARELLQDAGRADRRHRAFAEDGRTPSSARWSCSAGSCTRTCRSS